MVAVSAVAGGLSGLLRVRATRLRGSSTNTIEMTITNWELIEKPNPDDYKVEIPDGAKVDPKIK